MNKNNVCEGFFFFFLNLVEMMETFSLKGIWPVKRLDTALI